MAVAQGFEARKERSAGASPARTALAYEPVTGPAARRLQFVSLGAA
ncbi:hypothetical protein QF032_007649 [Streptomyces achromogenes]|nr:hypothetical protein [Streptomyces achromogenes]